MQKNLYLNPAQLTNILLPAKNKTDIWGRGTGKSNLIGWDINMGYIYLPRGIFSITGQSYTQILTRILPSSFSFLERLGYLKDIHYTICKKPPHNWALPYEMPLKFENFITFCNGFGLLLLSQDRAGSSRGVNIDYEIVDEALTINKEKYDHEVSPTNRGSMEYFKHISWHHGHHYVSSMPFSASGKWLLEQAKYYELEKGIRLFDAWNHIVKKQLVLLDIDDPKEFASQWNEINRLKNKIKPFISKNNSLFTLANAFDNIDMLKLSYIKNARNKMMPLTFLIEIMNMVMDKVEDGYYNIDNEKHIYYNAHNDDFVRGIADNTNFDFKRLSSPDSRYDSDCNPLEPIELVVDWGVNVSFLLACQQKKNSFNFIKEFYVKPEGYNVMVDDLADAFLNYYKHHRKRVIIFYRDKYGDEKRANSSLTYNDQFIKRLNIKNWHVVLMEYKGKEPPHHEKYLFWANILKEETPSLPTVRINGNNCKNFIISLNNTKVIEKDNKFVKDKSSEHKSSGILPEEATHSTDAADKIMWAKFYNLFKYKSTFIPFRSK